MEPDTRDDDRPVRDDPAAGQAVAARHERGSRRWSVGRRIRWILRREWERDRLHLQGLDRTSTISVAVVLAAFVGTAAVALAFGIAGATPGGLIAVPGRFSGDVSPYSVPAGPVVVALGTLAALSAAFAIWAARQSPLLARLTLGAIAVVSLSFWGRLVSEESNLQQLSDAGFAGARDVAPIFRILAAIAVAAALALPVVPTRLLRARGFAGWLAAAPGFLVIVLVVITAGLVDDIPSGVPALATFPSRVTLGPALVASIVSNNLVYLAPLFLVPFVLWQTAVWARFGRRDLALRLGRRADAKAWLLPALLTGKLTWLVLGYLDRLPPALGGTSAVWGRSTDDGPLAWLVAFALVMVAGAWLGRRTAVSVSERGFVSAALGVVGGMSSATLVAAALLVLAGAALLIPASAPATSLMASVAVAGDLLQWAPFATIAGAVVAGVILVRRPRLRSIGLFLLVFGAWGVPRAIDVAPTLADPKAPGLALLSIEPATFDALLTVVLAVLAIGWWTGRQRGARPESITLALVVSTLLVHTSTLAPSGTGPLGLYLGLLAPPLYSLFFDSRELNRPSADRANRVLLVLATAVALLAIVVDGLVLGAKSSGIDVFAQLLFGLPFGAMLVAATISARRRAERPAHPTSSSRRAALAGAGGGVLGMAALALVSVPLTGLGLWADVRPPIAPSPASTATAAPLPSPTPVPTPSDLELLAAFVAGAHARSSGDTVLVARLNPALEQAIGGDAAALRSVAADIQSTGQSDIAWTSAQPGAACFDGAMSAWKIWRHRLVSIGNGALGLLDGSLDEQGFLDALAAVGDGQQGFIDAVATAQAACGGTA